MRTGIISLALVMLVTVGSHAAEGLSGTPLASARHIPAPIPLSPNELSAVSGGEEIHVAILTSQNLNATVTGNTLNAGTVESGAVNFGNNALNGFNGIGNFVINTGNNNVLQGSLSVTVLTAAPHS